MFGEATSRMFLVIALGAVLQAPAVHATVRAREGVLADQTPIIRTSQGELYVFNAPGTPGNRIGRLPRRASEMVFDGNDTWAVTTGRRSPHKVRAFRISPASRSVEDIAPAIVDTPNRIRIEGVAGSDGRHLFLLPRYRFDIRNRRLEVGHLDHRPDLTVVRTLRRAGQTWYLAVGPTTGQDGKRPVRLLHSAGVGAEMLEVEAGETAGDISWQWDRDNLFLIYDNRQILRFHRSTLRLAEDLGPMLKSDEIALFVPDSDSYWVHGAGGLCRMERDILDGGRFISEGVPDGFIPLVVDENHIWFGAVQRGNRTPVISVAKGDGTTQSYTIRGRHSRGFRRTAHFVVGVPVAAAAVVVVIAVGVVTAPIWIPLMLAQS